MCGVRGGRLRAPEQQPGGGLGVPAVLRQHGQSGGPGQAGPLARGAGQGGQRRHEGADEHHLPGQVHTE